MNTFKFVIKKTLQALLVMFFATLFVSFAIRFTGDPVAMLTENTTNITVEDLAKIREALGLNDSFLVQYWNFIKGLFSGDLGSSFATQAPVFNLIVSALPATIILAFSSLLLSIVISVPLGIRAAIKKGTFTDQMIRIFSLTGISFPNFWLGSILILVFSVTLKLLPVSGFESLYHLILPTVTIAIILTATNVRLVRNSMLETLSSQYIMVARSKGLSERVVVYKHALKNSAIILITYFGLQFGSLMGGIVVVELVFNWPGIGTLAIDAIAQRDYPVLQGIIVTFALMIVSINLMIDILYGIADPRIKVE